jgi:hypothetical protein
MPCQQYGAPVPYNLAPRINEVAARERQTLLQDTDSGRLRTATIIETSFADLGLDSAPAFPPWAQAPYLTCGHRPYQGPGSSYRG